MTSNSKNDDDEETNGAKKKLSKRKYTQVRGHFSPNKSDDSRSIKDIRNTKNIQFYNFIFGDIINRESNIADK